MDFTVTRSLLVETTPRGRFAEERRILADHFPGFTLSASWGRRIRCRNRPVVDVRWPEL